MLIISVSILVLDNLLSLNIQQTFFSSPERLTLSDPLMYIRLFSYILGHANWVHLISNYSIILLVGPILEEKYSPARIIFFICITSVVTALLNMLLTSSSILGASGIVFMMILLVSISSSKAGDIPLSFILIAMLYLSGEVINMFANDSISQLAHIGGAICGSIFGFLNGKKKQTKPTPPSSFDNPLAEE